MAYSGFSCLVDIDSDDSLLSMGYDDAEYIL
jgi:hypothetical protein